MFSRSYSRNRKTRSSNTDEISSIGTVGRKRTKRKKTFERRTASNPSLTVLSRTYKRATLEREFLHFSQRLLSLSLVCRTKGKGRKEGRKVEVKDNGVRICSESSFSTMYMDASPREIYT